MPDTLARPVRNFSGHVPLCKLPVGLPTDWMELVNRPQTQEEMDALARCLQRGCPFGKEAWAQRMAAEWNLESTLRRAGKVLANLAIRDKILKDKRRRL